MKKFSKLCVALLLLVALDAQAGDAPPVAGTAGEAMSEQQTYDLAHTQFKAQNFRAAAQGFTDFVKRFPDSTRLSHGYFWVGMSYYGMQDCANAIQAFQTVIKRSTDTSATPHAMLYMAECQRFMQDKAAAWLTLNDLIKRFPSSGAAKIGKERLVGVGWGELVEFNACLDKSAPLGLLEELGQESWDRYLTATGSIDLNKQIEDSLIRHKALKDAEVSGCANTLFKAFSTEPDHPLKSAKMRYANALYKSLRSRELKEIDDKGTAHAMVIATHDMQQEIKTFNDNLLKQQQAAAQRKLEQEQAAAQRKQQLDAQRAKEEAYIRGMEANERKYQAENNALIEQYIQRLNVERSRQSWMDAAKIINEVTKPVIPPSLRCEPDPMAIVPGTLRCR